jgi:hypothetical protein
MASTKTPVQILKAKRVALLKRQRTSLLYLNANWLKVCNLDNPLHAEYDRQLRAARVTLNMLLKHAEEL